MARDGISMGELESAMGSDVCWQGAAAEGLRVYFNRQALEDADQREGERERERRNILQSPNERRHSPTLHPSIHPSSLKHGAPPLPVMGMAGSKLRALTEGPGGQGLRPGLQSQTGQPVAREDGRGTSRPWKDVPAKATHQDAWRAMPSQVWTF